MKMKQKWANQKIYYREESFLLEGDLIYKINDLDNYQLNLIPKHQTQNYLQIGIIWSYNYNFVLITLWPVWKYSS